MSDVRLLTKRYPHTVSLFYLEPGDKDWPPTNLIEFHAWLTEQVSKIPYEHRHTAVIDISAEIESENAWPNIAIRYHRPETDEEMQARATAERNRQSVAEQRERALFEQLQAKYGNL